MQSLSGQITTSGCASPDLARGLFQTRQPTQYCEWRNGVYADDAVCYCGTNDCNAKEMLENWIQNGGGCKLVYFLLCLETRKSIKDHKACDEELTTYLSVDKSRVKFKMHSASESSEIDYLKNLKRKIWAKTSSSIVKIEPNNGFEFMDL